MTAAVAAPATVEDAGARRTLLDALPLLAAVGLLMAGSGLTSTLVGVRAGLEQFSATTTGVVLAGYYAGFLVGSTLTPRSIRRVGHVRVFAGLASLASAAVLVHVVRPEPITWFALRALTGLCVAGLYVVTETWLNGAATNTTRGTLLAVYMVAVTGGLAGGQLLFSTADPGGFAAFVLASVLVSLAVVPVALATVRPPSVPEPSRLSVREVAAVAPLGVVGAALSGLTGAAVLGGGAVYASHAGLGRGATASLIGAALVGGLVLQAPLGRWSDRIDRRFVVAVAGFVGAALAVAAAWAGPDRLGLVIALVTVAGGISFPLYSLASAHLNDYLDPGLVIAAGSRMVMVNGAGAIAGPILAAAMIDAAGPGALFVVLAAAYLIVGAYALWRMTRRPAPAAEERAHYSPVPVGAGPTVATLQPGAGEELYPRVAGQAYLDGRPVPYVTQGEGEPLVVLGSPPRASGGVDRLLTALAIDGVRAVAPEADRADEVVAVLRDLGRHAADVLVFPDGAALADALCEHEPERVEQLIVVGSPGTAAPDRAAALVLTAPPATEDELEQLADTVAEVVRHSPTSDQP